jgi:hypothetical protein
MARASDEFELAWGSLDAPEDARGWRTIAVTPSGSCRLAAGRRFPGKEEALLVGFSNVTIPAAEKLPDGGGFNVERVDPFGDGTTWLALSRKPSGNADLFLAMVCDVAGALDDEMASSGPQQVRRFLGRVRAWQEFMRKGTQSLSPEAEIGLVGELTVLTTLIACGLEPANCIEAWVGPLDAMQDFELGTGAIEVKATLSSSGFPAKIGSLDQLDDAIRQPLFLIGVRLRQTMDGQSLPAVVDALRLAIHGDAEAERRLCNRLIAVGFFDIHADRYPRQFTFTGMRIMRIGEGFPRLTTGSVPVGITRAAYEIDLDKVEGEVVSLDQALTLLGAL